MIALRIWWRSHDHPIVAAALSILLGWGIVVVAAALIARLDP